MVKRRVIPSKKVEEPTYPSRYGSHASMVEVDLGPYVILKDKEGYYLTTKEKMDTGLVDQHRTSLLKKREQKLIEFCENLGKSFGELLQKAEETKKAEGGNDEISENV
jgi:hypothetical protein